MSIYNVTEWLERLTANVLVATCIPRFDTVESEERQMKQCIENCVYPPYTYNSPNMLALRKEVIHTVLYVVYPMQFRCLIKKKIREIQVQKSVKGSRVSSLAAKGSYRINPPNNSHWSGLLSLASNLI